MGRNNMTKKKGRPIEFHDPLHKKWREDMAAHNHKLYAICKEFSCSLKLARVILRKRKAEQELKDKGLQDV